jgi:hypothetical protein
MKSAVTAFLVLILGVVSLGQSSAQYARNLVKGPGYEIVLPSDVVVNLAPSKETINGFALDLLRPGDEHPWNRTPTRFIAFNTRWDGGDLPSLDAVVSHMLSNPESLVPPELHNGTVDLISTFSMKLGELPAKRMILQFKNVEKQPAIRQVIVAYRERPGATGLFYVLSLTTTRADFQQDVRVFSQLLSGFKLKPVD